MWMATEMPATRRAVMTALTTPAVRAITVFEPQRVLSVLVTDPVVVKEMSILLLSSGTVNSGT